MSMLPPWATGHLTAVIDCRDPMLVDWRMSRSGE
jgi:hypothetical protein